MRKYVILVRPLSYPFSMCLQVGWFQVGNPRKECRQWCSICVLRRVHGLTCQHSLGWLHWSFGPKKHHCVVPGSLSVKDGAVQFNGEPPFEKRTFDLAVQEFGNVLFVQGSPKPRSPNYSKTNVGIEKGLGERVLSVETGHESLAAARSMMNYLYRSMWYSPHDSRCSFVASKQPSLFCPLPFLNEGASQFNILQVLHETWECKLLGYATNSGHMLMTLFL